MYECWVKEEIWQVKHITKENLSIGSDYSYSDGGAYKVESSVNKRKLSKTVKVKIEEEAIFNCNKLRCLI